MGLEEWPECSNARCDEEVDPRRLALGYTTCLRCGSPAPVRIVDVPYNKGAMQLISPTDIKAMGRKTAAE